MSAVRLELVAAMSENRVIGRNGQLPWHMPADLAHFKRLTSGHWVAMGRRTFDSIRRPLPNRTNIIITRQHDFVPPAGALVAHDLEEAIALAHEAGQDRLLILGGADIYRLALPHASVIHLTLIHTMAEGDTFFPEFDASAWRLAGDQRREADAGNPHACSFRRYERIA